MPDKKLTDGEVMKALEEKAKKLEDDYKRLQAKAEAYKEFAERLKEKYKNSVLISMDKINNGIDNLLKELVGEDK